MGPRDRGRTVKEDALASFPVKSRQGKARQAAAAQALHRHAVTHPCQQIFGQQLDASVTFPEKKTHRQQASGQRCTRKDKKQKYFKGKTERETERQGDTETQRHRDTETQYLKNVSQ